MLVNEDLDGVANLGDLWSEGSFGGEGVTHNSDVDTVWIPGGAMNWVLQDVDESWGSDGSINVEVAHELASLDGSLRDGRGVELLIKQVTLGSFEVGSGESKNFGSLNCSISVVETFRSVSILRG